MKIFPKYVHNQVDLSVISCRREGKDKEKVFVTKVGQVSGGLGTGVWGQLWLCVDTDVALGHRDKRTECRKVEKKCPCPGLQMPPLWKEPRSGATYLLHAINSDPCFSCL